MQFIDSNTVQSNQCFQFDICIVGAGAAGITLANEFDNTDFQVCLLEAGGLKQSLQQERDLYEMEILGEQIDLNWAPRARYFGGSTNKWFGRIALLDEIDFEERPWVPNSGWPITSSEVKRTYKRAAETLKVPHFEKIGIEHWKKELTYQSLVDHQFEAGMFFWADWMRMGPKYHAKLLASSNIQLFLNANVQSLEAVEDLNHIQQIQVRNYVDQTFSIEAKIFILACGGNENPRLLLLSNSKCEAGIGNQHDTVGRYLIDHPRGEGEGIICLNPGEENLKKIEFLGQKSKSQLGAVQMHIQFKPEYQRKQNLLNHCIHVHVVRQGHNHPSYKALREMVTELKRKKMPEAFFNNSVNILKDLPQLVKMMRDLKNETSPVDHLVLIDQMEQEPNPESRIKLSKNKKDKFGQPMLSVDWRIDQSTYESQQHMHTLLAAKLKRLGIGYLSSQLLEDPGYRPTLLDMKHPMGTTRMSNDPKTGVVDSNCKVHGINNLFIAGSSVFPTGGYANPTFTIVALAIRLSDHIKSKIAHE